MIETFVDLIRHGEPEGGRRFRGHGINDPLSEKGWSQMWDAVGDECHWDKIISSPLARCKDFAEELAKKYGLPVEIDEQLKEVGFGSWEGRTPDEIQVNNPDEYKAFYLDPVGSCPAGAEPLNEFFARIALSYNSLVKENVGQNILVVAHAGVVRAVIAHVLGISPVTAYRIQIGNAGITRFQHDDIGAKLVFHNRAVL